MKKYHIYYDEHREVDIEVSSVSELRKILDDDDTFFNYLAENSLEPGTSCVTISKIIEK